MQPGGQERHWDRTYSRDSAFFGNAASEFSGGAMSQFRKAAVETVLELGCGQGRDTLFFAREGLHVTALDYSEAGLHNLEESAAEIGVSDRVVARQFDVREPLPFADMTFDACYSHMLLCMELSMEDLRFLMKEIHRVLKPGGFAIYSVRNTFDNDYGAGTHKSEAMYDIGGYVIHFFSEEQVRELAVGYEVVDLRRMQEGGAPRELFGVVLRKVGDSIGVPLSPFATRTVNSGSAADPISRGTRFG